MSLIRRALHTEPQSVELPALDAPPRFQVEARESKRLKAIAYLGDKWVFADTRQDFLARVQGLV